jgi:hypothetical protein
VALGKNKWSMAAFWVLKDSLLFLITKEAKNLRDRNRQSSKDVPNCSFNGVLEHYRE